VNKIFSEETSGLRQLPGRSGVYSRQTCNQQLVLDEENGEEISFEGQPQPGKLVKYCRICEFSCPVGKNY
jgi:epoxyqueuosine reductase